MPSKPDETSSSPTTGRSRTFRLFVSSTFQDLRAERNALHAHVFPRLRELCRRHGCRFQAIDLRWGVSEEAALDQQTMNICLREIERCHQVTPRPNFLVLLGDRYGWRPPPPRIPASEFDALLEHVTAEEAELLRWSGGAAGRRQGLVSARREREPDRVPAAPPARGSLGLRDARREGSRAPGRGRGVGEDRGPTAGRARARGRGRRRFADGGAPQVSRAPPPSRRSPVGALQVPDPEEQGLLLLPDPRAGSPTASGRESSSRSWRSGVRSGVALCPRRRAGAWSRFGVFRRRLPPRRP